MTTTDAFLPIPAQAFSHDTPVSLPAHLLAKLLRHSSVLLEGYDEEHRELTLHLRVGEIFEPLATWAFRGWLEEEKSTLCFEGALEDVLAAYGDAQRKALPSPAGRAPYDAALESALGMTPNAFGVGFVEEGERLPFLARDAKGAPVVVPPLISDLGGPFGARERVVPKPVILGFGKSPEKPEVGIVSLTTEALVRLLETSSLGPDERVPLANGFSLRRVFSNGIPSHWAIESAPPLLGAEAAHTHGLGSPAEVLATYALLLELRKPGAFVFGAEDSRPPATVGDIPAHVMAKPEMTPLVPDREAPGLLHQQHHVASYQLPIPQVDVPAPDLGTPPHPVEVPTPYDVRAGKSPLFPEAAPKPHSERVLPQVPTSHPIYQVAVHERPSSLDGGDYETLVRAVAHADLLPQNVGMAVARALDSLQLAESRLEEGRRAEAAAVEHQETIARLRASLESVAHALAVERANAVSARREAVDSLRRLGELEVKLAKLQLAEADRLAQS